MRIFFFSAASSSSISGADSAGKPLLDVIEAHLKAKPEHSIANLSQANENPPTGAPYTGTGFLVLNDAETSATVTATHNITIPLTGGHIHRGTAAVNGPVIFPFVAPYTSPVGQLTWAIPAADVVNLKNLGLGCHLFQDTWPHQATLRASAPALRGSNRAPRFLDSWQSQSPP